MQQSCMVRCHSVCFEYNIVDTDFTSSLFGVLQFLLRAACVKLILQTILIYFGLICTKIEEIKINTEEVTFPFLLPQTIGKIWTNHIITVIKLNKGIVNVFILYLVSDELGFL